MQMGDEDTGMRCLVVINVVVEERYGGRGRETRDRHTGLGGREGPPTAATEHPSSTITRVYP